ncbi:MAG: hypothetical protein E7269_08665 [Lachnospiraceae bacterium]|nr:hypothetical protein [Lachnospiraceae bacterium]
MKWQDASGNSVSTNANYSFTANATATYTAVFEKEVVEEVEKVRLTVAGASLIINGEPQVTTGYTENFAVGTEITLACGADGFVRWQNEYRVTMSESETYTFTIVTDTNLTAVTVADIEMENHYAFVEFVSDYGQVMNATTWFTNSTNKTLPEGPAKYGYVFKGWSYNGTDILESADDVKALIDGTVTHLEIRPVYEAEGTMYTIQVYYDDETTAEVYSGAVGSTLNIPAKAISGRKFSHWSNERNGETKLSTNESFYLKVSDDITLYAVYVDENVVVEKEPTVVVMDMSTVEESGSKKVVIITNHDVPDGYTIMQHGLIRTTSSTVGTDADSFVIGGSNVKQYTSSDLTAYGAYTVTINIGDSVDTVIYARGYMIVQDNATGEYITLYSSIVNGSYNSLLSGDSGLEDNI